LKCLNLFYVGYKVKYHIIRVYGEVGIYHHSFLSSTLAGDKWSVSRFGHFKLVDIVAGVKEMLLEYFRIPLGKFNLI
jgi:hypothetical protein